MKLANCILASASLLWFLAPINSWSGQTETFATWTCADPRGVRRLSIEIPEFGPFSGKEILALIYVYPETDRRAGQEMLRLELPLSKPLLDRLKQKDLRPLNQSQETIPECSANTACPPRNRDEVRFFVKGNSLSIRVDTYSDEDGHSAEFAGDCTAD